MRKLARKNPHNLRNQREKKIKHKDYFAQISEKKNKNPQEKNPHNLRNLRNQGEKKIKHKYYFAKICEKKIKIRKKKIRIICVISEKKNKA